MGFGYSHKIDHDATAYDRESGERCAAVHSSDQAAHVWAQGRVTFGRSGTGVVYFHGRALFDYGAHYCAAYLVDGDSVLINATYASPTTSGHVSSAQYAARPRTAYRVPDLTGLLAGKHERNLEARSARFGSVEGTAEFESAIDARLADREHVRAHCEKHALAMNADAMAHLLTRVGLQNSAAKIVRDAEAARDREAAACDRAAKAAAIDRLRDFARADDIAAHVLDSTHGGYSSSAGSRAADFAKRIRAARRTAGKDSIPPTLWREAWTRLGRLDSDAADSVVPAIAAAIDAAARKAGLRRSRRWIREHLTDVRRDERPSQDSPQISEGAHLWHVMAGEARFADRRAGRFDSLAHELRTSFPRTAAVAIASLERAGELANEYSESIKANPAFAAARDDWQASEKERKEREAAARALEESTRLARWQAGERVMHINATREGGAAYIRAVDVTRNAAGDITGGTLQTSQGANAPLVEAIQAFRFIKLVRERGTPWHANGAQVLVGHFALDRITAAGDMRAGCHAFAWQDIAALACELGVFDAAASDAAVTREREAA